MTVTGKLVMNRDSRAYTPDITKLASHMSDKVLKKRLCSAGPVMCPDCLLCEFGKEYLVREALKKEAV